MPNLIPLPLLADAGAVVGLLVLIFTVVGWLVNLANSQNNPPAPPPNRPRPPRPKGDRVQSEIDIFLKEVRGETVPQEDVVLESVPPEPRSRPALAPISEEPARSTSRGRLGSALPQLSPHVGETLANHHLASTVGETQPSRERHDPRTAGEMVALQSLGTQTSRQAAPIINLFRTKKSVQQAILVSEVLAKPKSMREE
jgi:hypothetical protein